MWTSVAHRKLANYADLTLVELASRCKVSKATLSMLRAGIHRYPSLKLACALHRETRIPPDEWLEGNKLCTEFSALNGDDDRA
jgi:transcriptional regulator with XRE-family HTH domain